MWQFADALITNDTPDYHAIPFAIIQVALAGPFIGCWCSPSCLCGISGSLDC